MLELKKVTEKQLKEIVVLTKELHSSKSVPNSFNNTRRGRHELDHPVWSNSEDPLRSPRRSASSKHVMKEFEAVQHERNQLLTLCGDLENQIKDSHKSLEESLIKII